jgi:hypothetical protein
MLFVEAAFQIQNNMFTEQQQQQQQQKQQQNEDRYGNEIKRRRMDDGSHLKVWRVCEFKYAHKQDNEYNEEDFVRHEEVRLHLQCQEEAVADQEVQEVVAKFAALAISDQQRVIICTIVQVQEENVVAVQEIQAVQEPPLQVLGRRVILYTADNQTVHGTIENLFDLNGERAIQIQTSAGENLIFTSSQLVGLEVLLNPNEEQLSPIASSHDQSQSQSQSQSHEVIQIASEAEDDDEINEYNNEHNHEVIQIADDDSDASTQASDDAREADDFPDVEFQAARPEQQERDCCAICLDMTDAVRNFVSLDCGHQFHFGCIMGNMANGGANRNQCPMCRETVVQHYDVHNEGNHNEEEEEEIIERLARGNQRMQDELNQTRQHRADLTEEYVRVMSMNMQIGMRHVEERTARDALEHRAEICFLNERIAQVVACAANNDIRQNYHAGGRVHMERQIRELCMCFGMMAYDAQYDQGQYDNQAQYDQHEDLMNHEIIEVD